MTDAPVPAQKRFEELLSFPTAFTFRAVGTADAAVQAACQDALAATLGRAAEQVAIQPSRAGSYWVIRLTATVHSGDEIRAVYAALDAVPQIRMVL